MPESDKFFPSIRCVVDKADLVPKNGEQSVLDGATVSANEDRPLEEIESLCMKCGEQGITRMLLTSIPFFREVIIMSFRCEHCGSSNNEIQSAGSIRPEGTVYTARILSRSDLNRQIVRSPSCAIIFPEYELTLPASRGQLTTVEGLIRDVITDLSGDQPLRRIQDEAAHAQIQTLIDKLKNIIADDEDDDGTRLVHEPGLNEEPMPTFTIKLDDPAGNSFIEFVGSMADPKWNLRTYHRTRQQNIDLGLSVPDEAPKPAGATSAQDPGHLSWREGAGNESSEDVNEEIYTFSGVCPSCGNSLNTLMKRVIIPYFKDIFIMSTNCDICGYRDNEVKSGSAISKQGKRITLKVEDREDLSRDILKSETSGLTIPEIDLILQPGTLGGRFTTLEGILDQVYEELSEKVFTTGDSSTTGLEDKDEFESFLSKLKDIKSGDHPFTLILDDPLANSHVQNLYAPDPDPNMEIVMYDRTWQQNEELGLNDMKVEGYENDAQGIEEKATE